MHFSSSNTEEFGEYILRANKINELYEILLQLRDAIGLANIAYHATYIPNTEGENPILILTYLEEWVKIYRERDYFRIDPVVLSGKTGFLPIDWAEVNDQSHESANFFSEADKYGVGKNGITIPIRAPAGERALLSITANCSDTEWATQKARYIREFQYLAQLIHDRAVHLSGLRGRGLSRPLSSREMQCLDMVARGLVPKQIAARLDLSSTAVRMYLQKARSKLGCSTVNQAIAKVVREEILVF